MTVPSHSAAAQTACGSAPSQRLIAGAVGWLLAAFLLVNALKIGTVYGCLEVPIRFNLYHLITSLLLTAVLFGIVIRLRLWYLTILFYVGQGGLFGSALVLFLYLSGFSPRE
jgi:hypothetical protein